MISPLIKGSWQLAGGHGAVDRTAAIRDMFAFAEAGITTFDCADIYTGVEALIGTFLREWRTVYPSLDNAIRVHTKYVPDLAQLSALTFRDVERAIDRSRFRLQRDTLDLVQFHWWDYDIPGMVDAVRHLATLRERGAITDIGATNFDTAHLVEMLDAGIPIATHQVQYSVLDRRPAGDMTALCVERNVDLFCYGVIAGGFLSEQWLGAPSPAEPLENRSLIKYRLIIDEFGGWPLFQHALGTLHQIAQRHSVEISTVAVRYTLDRPGVRAAIIGARNTTRIPSLLDALTLELTSDDYAELQAVLDRAAGPTGDVYTLERAKGGPHASIMKYDLNSRQAGDM